MRAAGVVVAQERGQPSSALCAVCPHPPVSPFAQASLDEALGFAVGLRAPAAGEGVCDAQRPASARKQPRTVGRAVVRNQALDAHAKRRVVRHGSLEKRHRRELGLIGIHLHKACARMVVTGHMHQPNGLNALNEQFAPLKAQSGILVGVHPAGLLCKAEVWEPQFPRPVRVNNLLKHHRRGVSNSHTYAGHDGADVVFLHLGAPGAAAVALYVPDGGVRHGESLLKAAEAPHPVPLQWVKAQQQPDEHGNPGAVAKCHCAMRQSGQEMVDKGADAAGELHKTFFVSAGAVQRVVFGPKGSGDRAACIAVHTGDEVKGDGVKLVQQFHGLRRSAAACAVGGGGLLRAHIGRSEHECRGGRQQRGEGGGLRVAGGGKGYFGVRHRESAGVGTALAVAHEKNTAGMGGGKIGGHGEGRTRGRGKYRPMLSRCAAACRAQLGIIARFACGL